MSKVKIRGERIKNGVRYITIQQVVQDFFSKRNNKTEDAEFEIIDPGTCIFDVNKIQEQQKKLGYLKDIDHEEIKKDA